MGQAQKHSRHAARTLLLLALTLLLTSCSTMKIAYNTANWWISWYSDDIFNVELNKTQKKQFKNKFRKLHQWHRETQLSLYAESIDNIGNDLNSAELTVELFKQREQEATDLLNQSIQQLIPAVADIVASLSDQQVEELLQNIGFKAKQNPPKKTSTEKSDTPQQKAKRRNKALERQRKDMVKTLKKWFGSINQAQHQIIATWVNKTPLPEDWVDPEWQQQQDQKFQQRKQQAIDILENKREQTEVIASYLKDILLANDDNLSSYQQQRKQLERQLTIDLLESITEKQQRHLHQRLLKLAKTLRGLTDS